MIVTTEIERPDDNSRQRRSALLTWILATGLGVTLAISAAIKWSQDSARHTAQQGLQDLGATHSIQAPHGRSVAYLTTTKPVMDDAEISALVDHATVLAEPHDLGLSPGLEFALFDLSGTGISPEAFHKLQSSFPQAEIRRQRRSQ